jgi:hypothetical protein
MEGSKTDLIVISDSANGAVIWETRDGLDTYAWDIETGALVMYDEDYPDSLRTMRRNCPTRDDAFGYISRIAPKYAVVAEW